MYTGSDVSSSDHVAQAQVQAEATQGAQPPFPADHVEQQLRGHRRPVGADRAGHGRRPGAGLGGQGRGERGRQGLVGRRRTVVCHADAQLGHPRGPVRLVRDLRHHHLRRAGPGGRRRGARAAVVHDGGHPAEQRLLVDLADDEAVVPVVDRGQVGPAAGEDDAAALRADRFDGHPGGVRRGAHGHAAEAHVHRWRRRPGTPPVGRERAFVGQDPRAGLHDVEVRLSCHGSRTGSAASHGRSVKTWSRTLSTGGRPIAARWLLSSASPYSAFMRWASSSHSTRLSVSSGGTMARPRQRPVVRRRQTGVWKHANT
jgi:hypothetical protein